MKNLLLLLLVGIFIFFNCFNCSAQKDFWRIDFPGYSALISSVEISPDDELNVCLNDDLSLQTNEFISLNKSGLVVFRKPTSESALLHFKDGLGNRYLGTYKDSTLTLKKYDLLGNLLWTTPIFFQHGRENSELYTLMNTVAFTFTSNGDIAIVGGFETTSDYSVFALNSSTGNLLFNFESAFTVLHFNIMNLEISQDNNGNFNVKYFDNLFYRIGVSKYSNSGIFIQDINYISGISSSNRCEITTENYLYFGIFDSLSYFHIYKFDKNNFNLILDYNTGTQFFGQTNFGATDNEFYISYSDFFGVFEKHDSLGNIICTYNGNDVASYSHITGSERNYFISTCLTEMDSLCNIDTISDLLPFSLFTAFDFFMGPKNGYVGNDIIYLRLGAPMANMFGVAGFVDVKYKNYGGKLYFDANNNCIADINELGIPNQLVKISPLNYYVVTDSLGNYKNSLDIGSYTLSGPQINSSVSLCNPSIPLSVIDTTTFYGNNNFGVQGQSGSLQDLSITLNIANCRPGFDSHGTISIQNILPLAASGVVKLTIDTSLFINFSSDLLPDSIIGSDYFWHKTNLGFYDQFHINFDFDVKSTAALGTPFSCTAVITNLMNEVNLINNFDLFQGTIVGAFDPNDKHVIPQGVGPSGEITTLDTLFNYKIQFQNTGNFLAVTVKIVDTLDTDLDISTFQLRSTSHHCQVSIINPNVLVFTFNDIMLPDSGSNEAHSHGFLNYSIESLPGLPISTEIRNKASIYFDFNEPLITNETVNTITIVGLNDKYKAATIEVFPNPAQEIISVRLNNLSGSKISIELYNLFGQKLKTLYNGKSTNQLMNETFDISNFQSGLYLIKVQDGQSYVSKFIKM